MGHAEHQWLRRLVAHGEARLHPKKTNPADLPVEEPRQFRIGRKCENPPGAWSDDPTFVLPLVTKWIP
jgi:hypothetical protein